MSASLPGGASVALIAAGAGRATPAGAVVMPVSALSPIRLLFAALDRPTDLRATVLAQNARGETQLRTEAGPVTVQVLARLAAGTGLTLRVDPTGGAPRLFLLRAPESGPRADAPEAQRNAPRTEPPAARAPDARAAPAVTVELGHLPVVRAVLLASVPRTAERRPPPAPAAAPPAAGAPAAGAPAAAPARPPAPAPPHADEAQEIPRPRSPADRPEAEAVRPVVRDGYARQAQAGAVVALRVLAHAPAAAPAVRLVPPPGFQPTPGATLVEAPVEAHLPRGETVVRTPAGHLALALPAGVPEPELGDRLLLELLPRPPVAPLPRAGARTAPDFPALRALDAALAAPDSGAPGVLPRPGHTLARQILRFVAAAEAHDPRPLLADAPAMLASPEAAKLLPAAAEELRRAAEPPQQPPDWRLTLVPLAVDQETRTLRVYTRPKRKRDGAAREEAARFAIECDHRALGALRIDGLVHGRTIDLVLHTESAVAAGLRATLSGLLDDACAAMGYAGTLAIRDGAPVPPVVPAAFAGLTA